MEPAATSAGSAAPRHDLRPDAEHRDAREQGTDQRAAPQAPPAARRVAAFAKPTVRVDGWEQHRHRTPTL